MSYQVLARKWRPRSFREMVGQEHVLRALINALDRNRLHHAYLFTGTRGVGKTTIARILAKCLNCEVGISSEPCGECASCREIAEGRFIDLIEVDAASRTKVEDTRDLLDNVQYAPTRGRYKIYLIDEVHMLSNSSFNALLKTLEEPPQHVKFLLATTDPQKLPITVLSRCLQFNLKNMSPERIVQHLQFVLREELVPFDEAAIWQLARSADGSMRDALSLTDQAIAFGNGKIADSDVSAMLGTIDHRFVARLISALIAADAADLLAAVGEFAEQSPDYHSALGDLITLLHRIAIAQALPEALDNSYGDREQILAFARSVSAEDVQLFYQTALIGRRDLHLVPDARGGFEMVLLRMLVFKPQGIVDVPERALPSTVRQTDKPVGETPTTSATQTAPTATRDESSRQPSNNAPTTPVGHASEADDSAKKSESETLARPPQPELEPSVTDEQASPLDLLPESGELEAEVSKVVVTPDLVDSPVPTSTSVQAIPQSAVVVSEPELKPVVKSSKPVESLALAECGPGQWLLLYSLLQVRGVLQSTVANCVLLERTNNQFYFALDEAKASLYDESHSQRLAVMLSDYFGVSIKAQVQVQALSAESVTPAKHHERLRQEARQQAIERLRTDPAMQILQRDCAANLDVESVTYSIGSGPESV